MRFRRHQESAQTSTSGLLALFGVIVLALVAAVNGALALVYKLSFHFAGYPAYFFETNTAIVLLYVLGGCWLESLRLREGGARVARLAGGRPAQVSGSSAGDRLERRFANVVQEMAIASRMPQPAAWVMPREESINALAAGWDTRDAVVAVTRGALERLTREELQGVVAHEFSHIAHGDARLNMRLLGMVWGLQMLFNFGRSLSRPDEHGRRPATTLFGLALAATGAAGWAAGRLLQAAVSRQREFLADASAVQYTRVVHGLGGALRKIAHQARHGTKALQAGAAPALAHMMLSTTPRWAWWSTHPPIEIRLLRLYGHDVDPLPAPVLPLPAAEEPWSAFAPGRMATPGGTVPAAPQASRDDAVQNPAWQGADAREADALERIGRWHGPGQCRTALLVLVHAPLPPDCPEPLREAAQADLAALGPAARAGALELLAGRLARAPGDIRRGLVRQARDAGRSPAALWRQLAMRHFLRGDAGRTQESRPLGALAEAVVAASTLLPLAMDVSLDDASRWQAKALRGLGMKAAAGCRVSLRVALGLRSLHPMQRPQIARAWVDATPAPWLSRPSVTEALVLACRLLDTPLPPALARRQPPPQ